MKQCVSSISFGPAGGAGFAEGGATASYGLVTTAAQFSRTSGGASLVGFASGSASAADSISIYASGIDYVSIDVISLQTTSPYYPADGGPFSFVSDTFTAGGTSINLPNPSQFGFPNPSTIINVSVAANVPLDFELSSSVICETNGDCGFGVSSSFHNGVQLSQIEVFSDSNFSIPVTGFDYGTASGEAYDVLGGTLVPEPPTLAIVGFSLVAAAGVRIRESRV